MEKSGYVAPAIRGHGRLSQRMQPETRSRHRARSYSTASCILANMSMELGRALSWDAQKGEILKDAEANQKLARAYRSPWNHPFG